MSITPKQGHSYSITALAREFEITTRTIRFYEESGILAPRRDGLTRVYTERDRINLKLILRGKRLGLSLAESRELIEMYNPGSNNEHQIKALLGKINERRDQLRQQLKDIAAIQKELDAAESRCLKALDQS